MEAGDGEPLLRKTPAERLKRLGFTPVVGESGETGLSLCQERPDEYSLVLIDVVMPGMGGIECVRRLLGLAPSLPVVLSSGFTREQLIGRDEHTKHVAFLKKPYGHAALLGLAIACPSNR